MLASHLGLDVSGGAVAEHEVYASIYNPGKVALLVAWKDAKLGEAWTPKNVEGVKELRHRKARVATAAARRETPQYYPEVKDAKTVHAEPARKKHA